MKRIIPILLCLAIPLQAARAQDGGAQGYRPPAEGSSPDTARIPLRFWGSVGPTHLTGEEPHFGARLALGADVSLDPQDRFFLTFQLTKPLVGEEMGGRFSGAVHRTYLFPGIGFHIIPHRLWVRASLGLGYLYGSHTDLIAKIKPAYALEAGYRIGLGGAWELTPSASFEHSGAARKSIALWFDDFSCALGDCESTGTIPRANIWSLNLALGYKL